MNCHRARMAMVERDLGVLPLGHERALDEHLAGCTECRASFEKERELVLGLESLRHAAPPEVDVRWQVLQAVRTEPRIETGWVSQKQLAWASAAAVAAATVLVAWIVPRADLLREAGTDAAAGTRALLSAAYSTISALKSLLVLPWRIGSALLETLSPMLESLGRFEPVVVTTIGIGVVSMMLTIVWIVGNDLRRPATAAWRKEE